MKDWTGNENSIWKILGASNHTDKKRQNEDYYATEPKAIDKLFKAIDIPYNIWECACGEKHLSDRISKYGNNVYSSDIIKRREDVNVLDFLKATKADRPFETLAILTNPPYKYAKEFVLKALDLLNNGEFCFMFLKLTFLEGKKRYNELFSKCPPCQVLVFSERVLCAKNADFEDMKRGGGSAVAYAWFVWEKGYIGETVIKWI